MDIFLIGTCSLSSCVVLNVYLAVRYPDVPMNIRLLLTLIAFAVGVVAGYLLTAFSKSQDARMQKTIDRRRRENIVVPPQIVGSTCKQCNLTIMFVNDAHVCPTCNEVWCKACQANVPCSQCGQGPIEAELVSQHPLK